MTPASLRMNYIEELKNGDMIYRKNQFWEFVHARHDSPLVEQLYILSLSVEFIKNKEAWMVNTSNPSNFDT